MKKSIPTCIDYPSSRTTLKRNYNAHQYWIRCYRKLLFKVVKFISSYQFLTFYQDWTFFSFLCSRLELNATLSPFFIFSDGECYSSLVTLIQTSPWSQGHNRDWNKHRTELRESVTFICATYRWIPKVSTFYVSLIDEYRRYPETMLYSLRDGALGMILRMEIMLWTSIGFFFNMSWDFQYILMKWR